ncbi:MAG: hypothetical protein CMJ81_01240 [Planctomycetaceae bacterium]|nr:hypothetical protein [Planctomycetaceae bacterium]MBP62366.1 hypothetical protein [Planctomycetaceae bacterium]
MTGTSEFVLFTGCCSDKREGIPVEGDSQQSILEPAANVGRERIPRVSDLETSSSFGGTRRRV